MPPSARSHVTCVSNQRMTHKNELETVTKSDTHCLLMTASGTVETRVEATVYIKDSDTHFRVQLVDDHPVVLTPPFRRLTGAFFGMKAFLLFEEGGSPPFFSGTRDFCQAADVPVLVMCPCRRGTTSLSSQIKEKEKRS